MRIGVTAALTDRSMPVDDFARAVEARGYDSLYLPEHTHLPVALATPPALVGGMHLDDYKRTVDPFVSLAAAAAVTDRILLGTGIALVAQHDPIVLAKQIATLDRLSGGRFVLGMGYGWNRDEAADHGVDFSARRALAREKVLCMQALWSEDEAEFHGVHVSLPPSFSWPKPIQQPRVRVLVGAARARSCSRPSPTTRTAGCPSGGRASPTPWRASGGPSRRRGVTLTPSRWSPSGAFPTRESWPTSHRSGAPRWSSASPRGPRPRCSGSSTTTSGSSPPDGASEITGPGRATMGRRRRGGEGP